MSSKLSIFHVPQVDVANSGIRETGTRRNRRTLMNRTPIAARHRAASAKVGLALISAYESSDTKKPCPGAERFRRRSQEGTWDAESAVCEGADCFC
jgi:hypothetical protein